ncbi:MAG: signal recognition particle protein, partial [Planctomycetaceae bacterium]|nr:signal recognition particle protein [Planctomycetaceae bacterium]
AAGRFTLEDFLKSMEQISRMGSMKSLLKLIPGMGQVAQAMDAMDGMDPDKDVKRIKAIIQSMTLDERQNPDRIDRSRRNRIARGSGTDPAEINDLLKQFKGMAGMMKDMMGMGMSDRLKAAQQMQGAMMNPNAQMAKVKGSTKQQTDRNVARDKKKQERKRAKQQRKKNKRK